jgi:hypothetical protein
MRAFSTLIVALTLTGCGVSAGTPNGGVRGTVTAGPVCPVERQGSPCPPAPWTGTVRATAADGATFDIRTDREGAFELHLPHGTYTVAAVVEGPGPPTAKPVAVIIVGGTMQRLDLQVDTGIR